MSYRRIGFVIAFLLAVLAAGAAPASAQANPESEAAAKELVIAMRADQQLKNIFPVLMQQIKQLIAQGKPEAARDFDAAMPIAIEAMNESTQDFVAQMAALYARNFTGDELRQLAAFYKTPAGQKMLDKQPVLLQESAVVGQRWGQSIAAKLKDRMTDEMKKRGHN